MSVIFVPFKHPSLTFLPQAHNLALHHDLLLREPLQPQVLVHVLSLQILGQLAVLLDLVEELDLLFSFLFKLQVQGLDRLLALDEKHIAG